MAQSSRLADATYHSFNDIELLEPPAVPSPPDSRGSSSSKVPDPRQPLTSAAVKMPWQGSADAASPSRPRTRPAARRAAESCPRPSVPPPLLYGPRARARVPSRPPSMALFQFPSPDLVELAD